MLRHLEAAPAAPQRCSRCDQPSRDLQARAHGEAVCGRCRRLERARFEQATGTCALACGYELAWHIGERCPTEAEARERSGAQ